MSRLATTRGSSYRDAFENYGFDIGDAPLLSVHQERELARRIAGGDAEARDEMVRANLRLVVNIARGYAGKGLPMEDLIAEGNLGLLRAVEGFDADMSTRFSTYAAFWIRESIRRALTSHGKAVRLPKYASVLVGKWRRAAADLQEELGRPPSREEVAARLALPPRLVRVVEDALRVYQSGQAAGQTDDDAGPDRELADDRGATPDDRLAAEEEVRKAVASLGQLPEREAAVLRMRFGLGGEEPRTLQEVGDRLGLTRERARQIERDALSMIRGQMDPPEAGRSSDPGRARTQEGPSRWPGARSDAR